MKISVMTYAFPREFSKDGWDWRDFVRTCAQLGADGVELSSHLLKGVSDQEILDTVGEAGVEYPVHIAHTDFVVADESEFQRAVDVANEEIQRAKRLGVPIVMLVPGSPKPDIPDEEGRALIAKGLQACAEYGRRIGVVVTNENHGFLAQFRGRIHQMLYFIEHAPSMLITFDDGNFLLGGDDPHEALDALFDRVVHVHLKDLKAVPATEGVRFLVPGRPGYAYEGVLLGTGDVDTARIVRTLKTRGYKGYLSIENFGQVPGVEGVRHAIEFLRKELAKE